MNNDVLTEILLHLPVQSLLRFRAVCKFWGDVIDSWSFKKLHTHKNNSNKLDGMVHLQVSFLNNQNRVQKSLSIKLQHNDKSLMLYESDQWLCDHRVSLVGAVKGLICINPNDCKVPIAICNPFLGQFKILPLTTSSSSNSCHIFERNVAIGFVEDYKVVQLLLCSSWKHHRRHFQLYSRRTNSWRELSGDDGVFDHIGFDDHLGFQWRVTTIESWCKNGYFAHWRVSRRKLRDIEAKILRFDMKREVFRTITLPDYNFGSCNWIFAEDGHSFVRFELRIMNGTKLVKIYESRCEGSELSWNHVKDVEVPFCGVPVWRTGCVFFKGFADGKGAVVYDYRARKFIERRLLDLWEIFEYRGSFVSLEN